MSGLAALAERPVCVKGTLLSTARTFRALSGQFSLAEHGGCRGARRSRRQQAQHDLGAGSGVAKIVGHALVAS